MRAVQRSVPLFLLAAVALTAACNDVPAGTQCEGFELQVNEEQTSREAVKLDFLWVVDNSTSMCQEQASLAESIDAFVSTLGNLVNIDIRTAVVTTDVLSARSLSGANISAGPGVFNDIPATEFPPHCQASRLFPAREDLYCECALCACGCDPNASEGDPLADAACPELNAAFAYQSCLDDDSCQPTAEMAEAARIYINCLEAQRCSDNPVASQWTYSIPTGALRNLYNANGSVNASCSFRCGGVGITESESNLICRDVMCDEGFVCQMPGGDPGSSGCIKPPDTATCDDTAPVLYYYDQNDQNIDKFRCIATVGAQQSVNTNLEQGLKAAWLALDPDGPNPLQVCDPNDTEVLNNPNLSDAEKRERCQRRFLRENAFLVIIFVSDEDDCSVDDGKKLVAEDYNSCALLGDEDTDPRTDIRTGSTSERPLAPVFKFANRFRSLKDNPANVFVAAIVGDAWFPEDDAAIADADTAAEARSLQAALAVKVSEAREAYFDSKVDLDNPARLNTYVCASEFGRADLGLRYVELTEMFGPHGFRANICSDDGIGPALENIAEELISEVVTICLPRPVKASETGEEVVQLYKTQVAEGVEGDREQLIQGEQFQIIDEPELGACPGSGRAIRFERASVPGKDDKIELIYEAETACGL